MMDHTQFGSMGQEEIWMLILALYSNIYNDYFLGVSIFLQFL